MLEFQDAFLFLALPKVSREFIQVVELFALSRLEVVFEVAVIRDVALDVGALAVGFAVAHLAFVVVAVLVDDSAVA